MSTFFWSVPKENVKNLNKHAIIDLIRFTPNGISRVELARELNLTRAAITSIINDLQAMGIVDEVEGQIRSGRKPIVLEINPHRGYVVGMDMGATHVTMLLANYAAHVVKDVEWTIDIDDGPQKIISQIDEHLHQMLMEMNLRMEEIKAICLGVPGPVVLRGGMVSEPPIMPGWDKFPIESYIQSLWDVPVTLGNDAELGAIGEWAYGAGRGEENLAYVKVGRGIGAGMLLDGQIYHGADGSAGEIGHITIDENGPLCSCGNRGCLEAMAGGNAVAKRAVELVKKGQRTELSTIRPVDSIQSKDVIAAACNGDLVAQQILSETGAHLGTAIAGLVNLFNPSMIIIGGGVSQIGDLLLEPIRQTVQKRSLRMASKRLRISTALLGRRSSAMGAVVQALSLILHQEIEN
ncbi:MAG: ROK family protein [Anaerolineaceae bacterium]|nr:ROK family protein [Anaerolineaceae bacterium]